VCDVTRILSAIEQGDAQAADQLLPLVYGELRRLAAGKLAHEKPGQTLQATALVHEAYLRLVDDEKARHWDSRGHFFAAAAEAMRRILVDRARRYATEKHGGQAVRKPFDEGQLPAAEAGGEMLAVHEVLDHLAATDQLSADLVKLRYFVGLTMEEAAEALGISTRKAYDVWAYARSWLRRELAEG
jgi:RNA polymerase sigma factor (TIGR02999 family)